MRRSLSEKPPDLRDKIVENRGTLKKLQLMVPGLKEYRQLEDIRAADQLLRKQVSDKLNDAKARFEDLRKAMTIKGDLGNLPTIGVAISQIQQLAGTVLHAQQGSAGISPNIRIDDNTLNKLYEYDFNFVTSAQQIFSTASDSLTEYNSGISSQEISSKIIPMLDGFKRVWQQRLDSVEDILVTK
jgi:hypothetical protein